MIRGSGGAVVRIATHQVIPKFLGIREHILVSQVSERPLVDLRRSLTGQLPSQVLSDGVVVTATHGFGVAARPVGVGACPFRRTPNLL